MLPTLIHLWQKKSTEVDNNANHSCSLVIIVGTTIGVNAINSVSQMQDAKMTRFCKSVPVGASYDEMCKDFR